MAEENRLTPEKVKETIERTQELHAKVRETREKAERVFKRIQDGQARRLDTRKAGALRRAHP